MKRYCMFYKLFSLFQVRNYIALHNCYVLAKPGPSSAKFLDIFIHVQSHTLR